MTGTRGQDDDVARANLEALSLDAAKLHDGIAASNAKHFMGLRMIVHKIVDRVPPGTAPPVRCEQGIDDSCGIKASAKSHGCAVDNERPLRMIRDDTVIFEENTGDFAAVNHSGQRLRIRL